MSAHWSSYPYFQIFLFLRVSQCFQVQLIIASSFPFIVGAHPCLPVALTLQTLPSFQERKQTCRKAVATCVNDYMISQKNSGPGSLLIKASLDKSRHFTRMAAVQVDYIKKLVAHYQKKKKLINMINQKEFYWLFVNAFHQSNNWGMWLLAVDPGNPTPLCCIKLIN